MNLFKILIPKEKAQEITEMESFSVTWWVKTGWSDDTERMAKVFINKAEAKEFRKQLRESAKFIGAWIETELKRN
jgi:hypothetical protein